MLRSDKSYAFIFLLTIYCFFSCADETKNCKTFYCEPGKEIAELEVYHSERWKLDSFEYLKTNFRIKAFDE
jgi:hypothetical protein